MAFALLYGALWCGVLIIFDPLRGNGAGNLWSLTQFVRQMLLGLWFYAVAAGISYTIQTRNRLHEKETLAARAEALATAARLDALRARLNPHFLFNALHTLAALVKFRPTLAEGAVERLGDMLRYALKEDSRGVVEFSEEYDFTRQYLDFEQLRYEDRLQVHFEVDSECFNFELPPFSIQTLAENAVHHAIATRAEGGSIAINCTCRNHQLLVTVRDDGTGSSSVESRASHQFGLRSLRERLICACGPSAELRLNRSIDGFEATLVVPATEERTS